MPVPLYLLAVAVFAMGTSEFMLAGLLPDVASSLDVSVGTAGFLTSAFAVGMIVGAPLMAAVTRTWPKRSSLLGFVVVFQVMHVLGALTSDLPLMLVTRVIAAMANAGFLAVALTAAASLVPPDRKGRALSVLLSGTTVATIAGVPGGALLGAVLGWRASFWAVAMLCVPAALGVLKGIPATPTTSAHDAAPERVDTTLHAELRQLAKPRLLLVMGLGALINGATFGAFTYVAPIVTDTADLSELWVPIVLVLFGLGAFLGVTIAGRLSDRHPARVLATGGPLLLVGWIALATLAASPAALLVLVFVQGTLSFALGSTLIARVLYEAAGAPTMGGSYATAALNVGAAGGPLIAAATLTAGRGDLGPVWASSLLVTIALLVALPRLHAIAPRPMSTTSHARSTSDPVEAAGVTKSPSPFS